MFAFFFYEKKNAEGFNGLNPIWNLSTIADVQ